MIEKINNNLIQPVPPVKKSENEDDAEKRKEDRIRKAKEELEKKQKSKDNKDKKIDIFV